MRWSSLFVMMVLLSAPGYGQLCQTISSGSITDVSNWLCDCNIEQCDTLLIAHAMTVEDTLTLGNAVYTEVTISGSLTGDAVVALAGSLVNHGTIALDRLATDVDWIPEYDTYFTNHGTVTNGRLILFADSTRNMGSIMATDSLVIGAFRRLYNDAALESRIIYGLGGVSNTGTINCDSLIASRELYNYGSMVSEHLFELYRYSINTGTIWADEYNQYSGSFYNEGSMAITGTTSLGVYGGIQFEQTPSARLTTRNLYVLENTDVRGLGSICILEHAENHGNLIGSMQLCDLTPTMTTPPYWDVHTGTIVLNPTYCGPLACATVDVPEPDEASATKLFPNPSTGMVHVELGTRAEAVHAWVLSDALGRRMMNATEMEAEQLTLDLSAQVAGSYWLVLQDAEGEVMERLRVVLMR